MSLGYVCVKCGWMKSTHILGDGGVRQEDRSYLDNGLPGMRLTFRKCRKYTPSAAEKAEIDRLNEQTLEAVCAQSI